MVDVREPMSEEDLNKSNIRGLLLGENIEIMEEYVNPTSVANIGTP